MPRGEARGAALGRKGLFFIEPRGILMLWGKQTITIMERVVNQKRRISGRVGFSRKDDTLAERILKVHRSEAE